MLCRCVLPSDSGMEMMTPFPVPTHSRPQDTIRAVILTKEKPSLPVPATHTQNTYLFAVLIHVQNIWRKEVNISLKYTHALNFFFQAIAHVFAYKSEDT